MDEADIAQRHMDRLLESQIEQARNKAVRLPVGECLNCGEGTDGRRYCDADCRTEFERRAAADKRVGRT